MIKDEKNINNIFDHRYRPTAFTTKPGIIYVIIYVIFCVFMSEGVENACLLFQIDHGLLVKIGFIVLFVGTFLSSVIITVFYREWIKQHWHVSLIVFVLSGFLLTMWYVLS